MIFPWLSIFDLQNLYSNVKKPFECSKAVSQDYTIIVPVYGDPSFLQNMKYLAKHKSKVIIASVLGESPKMDTFLNHLSAEGFKIGVSKDSQESGLSSPTTYYSLMKQTVETEIYDSLRKIYVETAKTKYVCFLDGDSVPQEDLGKAVAVMEREGLELASVNIVPSSRKTFIEKMQTIEYNTAMLSRNYRPWLTSGACCIGRTEVMKQIMRVHSLYFAGGDVEIGLLAHLLKKRVGHINFKVSTNVPNTFNKWFRQRINWYDGSFRLFAVNFDKFLFSPVLLTYMLGLAFVLVAFKFSDMLGDWWILPLMLLLYIPLTIIVNWKVRERYMLLFPLYAGFQSLVMPVLGVFKYFEVAVKYRRFGRINEHRTALHA